MPRTFVQTALLLVVMALGGGAAVADAQSRPARIWEIHTSSADRRVEVFWPSLGDAAVLLQFSRDGGASLVNAVARYETPVDPAEPFACYSLYLFLVGRRTPVLYAVPGLATGTAPVVCEAVLPESCSIGSCRVGFGWLPPQDPYSGYYLAQLGGGGSLVPRDAQDASLPFTGRACYGLYVLNGARAVGSSNPICVVPTSA